MRNENLLNRNLIDMHVIVDIPVRVWERYGTPEYWEHLEKELNYEIKEMEEFIRDHRSRDYYGIYVQKEYLMHCKFCGHEYVDGYNGIVDCCEKALDLQQEDIKELITK